MKKKSLMYRYLISFVLVSSTVLILFSQYKNDIIKDELENYIIDVKEEYYKALRHESNLVKLVFSNSILYDKHILKIFKQIPQNKEKAKEELYKHLKDTYHYFDSFGIKHINFYLPNNEIFLKMENKFAPSRISEQKSIQYTNKTKRDFEGFEVDKDGLYLKFVKAFFDEELNSLGAIEIKVSVDNITKNIEQNISTQEFMIYRSENKAEESFPLNKNFKIDSELYSKWKFKIDIFDNLDKKIEKYTSIKLNKKEEFTVLINKDNKEYVAIFTLASNSFEKVQKDIYLVSLREQKNLNFLVSNILVFALILSFLVITLLLYFLKNRKTKEHTAKRKYKDLVKAIDKYVIMIESDTQGKITSVTQAFCDVSSYTQKELIGKNISILRHPDMSDNFFKQMWKELSQGKTWQGEIKNLDKNGNSYWVKGTIFPKYDIHKNVIGYVSIRVNITNAKQLKKINNLLKEDLSTKLTEIRVLDKNQMENSKVALMSKILDSTAYQWRNPISKISIHLANLKAKLDSKEIHRDSLNFIHTELENEIKLLSYSLNDFKSLFDGSKKDSRYNVLEVLNETNKLLKNDLDKHNIKLSINCAQEIFCFGIFTDLKQAIINLLKDVIENITLFEDTRRYIQINVIQDEGSVLIKCKDSVKNYPEALVNNIFSEKNEEEISNKNHLNLYLVKLLVEKTGSSIWCECDENSRTFYLKLIYKDRRKSRR